VITVRSWLSLTSKFILHFICFIISSLHDNFALTYECWVLKHHTTYHVKQQPPGNSCGIFVCINMLCFGLPPFTNVSVSPFICTLLSSFIFTHAFYLLLIHFLVISWQDYDVKFINKNGSSLKHIRERIAEFLVTQVINPKGEFHFG
jgi:hypothetical protein